MKKVIFLDRDGVINVDRGYVHRWCEFEITEGAIDAMRKISQIGFDIIIVTNQSGIARAFYSENDYLELTYKMLEFFDSEGVKVVAVYHCPHHPEGSVEKFAIVCGCRKPLPGMLLKAKHEHNIDLSKSILIGDKFSDILAARAAGIWKAYLITTNAIESRRDGYYADAYFPSLLSCVNALDRWGIDAARGVFREKPRRR